MDDMTNRHNDAKFVVSICRVARKINSHLHILTWANGAKLAVIVDKDKPAILYVYDHIGLPIPIHILKTQRDRRQILPFTN